jgi:hypothetical protein
VDGRAANGSGADDVRVVVKLAEAVARQVESPAGPAIAGLEAETAVWRPVMTNDE